MVNALNLARKDLSHVNLAMANLAGADLHAAILREATLKETNLAGADLTDADLTHANLAAACLRHATVAHANLQDADLRDADLEGANLRGAHMAGAKLRDADRVIAEQGGAEFAEGAAEAGRSNREPSAPPEEPTFGYAASMGTEVRGVDGEHLGQVAAAWPSYVFVEASPGADAGYWVPVKAFADTEGAALILSVTRDEAERRGWTERPPAGPEKPR
jgi:hypothetical protein